MIGGKCREGEAGECKFDASELKPVFEIGLCDECSV